MLTPQNDQQLETTFRINGARVIALGLQLGKLTEEEAAKMMRLIEGNKMVNDGGSVYPTAATKNLAKELNF